jgi:hypothetical protein
MCPALSLSSPNDPCVGSWIHSIAPLCPVTTLPKQIQLNTFPPRLRSCPTALRTTLHPRASSPSPCTR